MTRETGDDPLARAHSVGLIVHGVGDHSDVDIIEQAAIGFGAAFGNRDTSNTSRVTVRLAVDGDLLEALEVKVEGQSHLIIPFVWSQRRLRLTQPTQSARPIPLAFLIQSFPAVTSFLNHLPGTVLKGDRVHQLWMLPVALLIWIGVFGLIGSVVWLVRWHISYISERWLGSGLSVFALLVLVSVPVLMSLVQLRDGPHPREISQFRVTLIHETH